MNHIFRNGDIFYSSILNGEEFPIVGGGWLCHRCELMGLGKTIEILALTNPNKRADVTPCRESSLCEPINIYTENDQDYAKPKNNAK